MENSEPDERLKFRRIDIYQPLGEITDDNFQLKFTWGNEILDFSKFLEINTHTNGINNERISGDEEVQFEIFKRFYHDCKVNQNSNNYNEKKWQMFYEPYRNLVTCVNEENPPINFEHLFENSDVNAINIKTTDKEYSWSLIDMFSRINYNVSKKSFYSCPIFKPGTIADIERITGSEFLKTNIRRIQTRGSSRLIDMMRLPNLQDTKWNISKLDKEHLWHLPAAAKGHIYTYHTFNGWTPEIIPELYRNVAESRLPKNRYYSINYYISIYSTINEDRRNLICDIIFGENLLEVLNGLLEFDPKVLKETHRGAFQKQLNINEWVFKFSATKDLRDKLGEKILKGIVLSLNIYPMRRIPKAKRLNIQYDSFINL